MYEVRQLDATWEKPLKKLVIFPGAAFIVITYLIGFWAALDIGFSKWLHDFFSSLEDGDFLFYIAKDLPYAGYDKSAFLAHNLTIAFLGPLLSMLSILSWRGVFMHTKNENVNACKIFLINFLMCIAGAAGNLMSIYINDHKTGFCGGCEYNYQIFPIMRYLQFFVVGIVICQIFNSFFFLRSKLNGLPR